MVQKMIIMKSPEEERLFALCGRYKYRELLHKRLEWDSMSRKNAPKGFSYEERQDYFGTAARVAKQSDARRVDDIARQSEEFAETLFNSVKANNFTDARQAFLEKLDFDPSAIQRAGFTNAETMEVARAKEAEEAAKALATFREGLIIGEKPVNPPSGRVLETEVSHRPMTPESMAIVTRVEGRLKKRGQLVESGATDVDAVGQRDHVDGRGTSESFLKKLRGHHTDASVEIMTHAGWRDALEVQAQERAKAAGKREV